MTATWPCGSAKSTGNAFTWLAAPVPAKALTPADINRAKARAAWRKKQLERVNKNTHIGAHCGTTPGQRAAR